MRWELSCDDDGDWIPATVPGTVAGALAAAGRWAPGDPDDFDDHDWVFRARFDADPAADVRLCLDGIATCADVELNGRPLLSTSSMFVAGEAEVGSLLRGEDNELRITCRALTPLLAAPRRPRARWRTRLVDNALRWHRTMLLGRAPGIAPSPAVVGPWRPVRLEHGPRAPRVVLLPRIEGADGVLAVRSDGLVEVEFGGHTTRVDGEAEIRVTDVRRWWPHTHGEPWLYDVRVDGRPRRVGFRDLAVSDEGFGLVVNGVDVFARGAVWMPVGGDPRPTLELARGAGMNIVRVVGTAAYEDAAFHDACDELGLLVWQDFMFANLDYPIADDGFRALVETEVRQALATVAGRPSLAVLCGNSEVEQQVAMLGLDPALGRGPLFDELLPALCDELAPGVPYVPSAPSGGARPFRPDEGVAHWFGVGGYRRPLTDTRLAGVRFAAECLAFANPGDDDGPDAWAPADHGAEWTFADVREHYAREAGMDTGEVMAEVFGEWRRGASPCAGGIVLWLRDLRPGAGWGVIDHLGRPKAALGHLRRALAPVAVWMTDEGMSGIAIHVANDAPTPLVARLRVSLYTGFEVSVGEAVADIELPAFGTLTRDAEEMLGRFADVSYAYRFGPPAQDVVVASLEDPAGGLLGQAFRYPTGRPTERESAAELGFEASLRTGVLTLSSRRLVHGVRIHGAGTADDAFALEPGRVRALAVTGDGCRVGARNLEGLVEVRAT